MRGKANFAHATATTILVEERKDVAQRDARTVPIVFWALVNGDLMHIENEIKHFARRPGEHSIVEAPKGA